MPICEVYFRRGLFAQAEIDKIAERLTDVLLQAEGFENNTISRSLCFINMMPCDSMIVGARASETGKVVIKIHVFQDAYTDVTKKGLHAEIAKVFAEESEACRGQEARNVWSLVLPVADNDFAAGGRIATLDATRKLVASAS